MGNLCASNQKDNIQTLNLDDKQYSLQERVAEMQQFLTLSSLDTKVILDDSKDHTVSINDFIIEQYIGKGAFGKVYSAIYIKTGDIYAMKIIKKSKLKQNASKIQALSQRLILQALDHPFLVKLHFAFHNMAKIYMMVDFMQGGEFFYLIRKRGKLTEDEARFYAAQIFCALEYLHSKNIMYRDLKPENVLMDLDGHIKITDFGISKVTTYSLCGTPQYIAPEVLHNKGYNFASDWFSYGSLVYDMLTGKPPLYSKNQMEIISKKLDKNKINLPRGLSNEGKSFLGGLLKFNPQQRLGSKGSEQIKNHPFFRNINFQDLIARKITPPINIRQNIQNAFLQFLKNKPQSQASSFLIRSFQINFDKELNNFGFYFNKHKKKLNQQSTLQLQQIPKEGCIQVQESSLQ